MSDTDDDNDVPGSNQESESEDSEHSVDNSGVPLQETPMGSGVGTRLNDHPSSPVFHGYDSFSHEFAKLKGDVSFF